MNPQDEIYVVVRYLTVDSPLEYRARVGEWSRDIEEGVRMSGARASVLCEQLTILSGGPFTYGFVHVGGAK